MAQSPAPLPIHVRFADVAAQTDLSIFLAANKDTQYPEYKHSAVMPTRSLCLPVSIPLKSPPATLQPLLPAVQKILSVPQGRVTIVTDAVAGDTECGTPPEPEEVVAKAVDLGH